MTTCQGAKTPERHVRRGKGPELIAKVVKRDEMDMIAIREVMKHLPHRYPFLLIDRVLEVRPGESLTAIKNVTINEPFFQGHFPGLPLMPGVLILEALAQASGILAYSTPEHRPPQDCLYLFVGVNKARFKRQVEPGDQLRLHIRLLRMRRGYGLFDAQATVDEQVACAAELLCGFKETRP